MQRLLLTAETFCLTKCTHPIGKKKSQKQAVYLVIHTTHVEMSQS